MCRAVSIAVAWSPTLLERRPLACRMKIHPGGSIELDFDAHVQGYRSALRMSSTSAPTLAPVSCERNYPTHSSNSGRWRRIPV
jgi:hypothetical protein